jgi:hypothetical protein
MSTDFDKFCSNKGYAMVKLFGFMLAVAAMVSSANAALLVSYEYGPDQEKDPTFAASGLNALASDGQFNWTSGANNVQRTLNNDSTVRQERFDFTPTSPNYVELKEMKFDTGLVSAPGTRGVSFTPSFKLNGVAVASNLYSVSPASGFGTYTVTFTNPLKINGGVLFRAELDAKGLTGSGSTTFSVDNVMFNGDVIPEPASMAVFGLLGAGVAFRRLRRKA